MFDDRNARAARRTNRKCQRHPWTLIQDQVFLEENRFPFSKIEVSFVFLRRSPLIPPQKDLLESSSSCASLDGSKEALRVTWVSLRVSADPWALKRPLGLDKRPQTMKSIKFYHATGSSHRPCSVHSISIDTPFWENVPWYLILFLFHCHDDLTEAS